MLLLSPKGVAKSQVLLRPPSSALWRRGIFTKLACVPCIRSGYGGLGRRAICQGRLAGYELQAQALVRFIEFAWLFPSPTKSLEC